MNHPTTVNRNSSTAAFGEPIAIIGLGCRLPGSSNDWRSYWELLQSGVDAISETPANRWNLQKFYAPGLPKPGKTQSKWGGYVDDIEQFDPQLFGISPREAIGMDPQQRMLLEVAFRALEDAGLPNSEVAGEPVSVFVGISSFDYVVSGLSFQDRGVIDAYSNTGGSSSIAANRISYCFDLRGPSVAVDTACSSSLVAVHMACESIWRGEASMALAGGVNALLLPDFYVAFSQLGVLAADGRCKTFDALANGYVRSEGAGMAVLKPLSAAIRDKDPIYAVIRSTALNQDGRTPGMTVPSQEAQETLLRTACAKAGIRPADIQYVEAHGTGTPVGDPIEASALGTVLGEGRCEDSPCWIGSAKTNIGHLEAGAGIASLIKTSLALHHRRIPAHLHFKSANPDINFDALKLRIPTETVEWDSETSRLAGINGFGYGGANAHVILEQAPEQSTASMISVPALRRDPNAAQEKAPGVETGGRKDEFAAPVLLPLSARSKPALQALATRIADWLEGDGGQYHLAEIAGYVAHRRSHHDVRTTTCAVDHAGMISELRTLAASSPSEFAEDFGGSKLAAGPVFVCSGQGPQWWAMGRGLLKHSPAFRAVIKKCAAEFSKYASWSVLEELERSESQSRMQKTSIAQPSIFAIQVALAAVWESWGIKPTAVVGHSVGEIAAAYLAGALSFEDACCVALHRGRTMDLASSQGAMVAAGLAADEVPAWLEGIEQDVSLAAINGPSSVTISGAARAIEGLATRLEGAGVFCRRLAVEYAFHSPQMEPVREELLSSLAGIQPREATTMIISTVTGRPLAGTEMDADYWWKNVRQGVLFSDAMTCLAGMGYGVAVEVGPHPVLAYSINECFTAAGSSVRSVASLNRQQDDLQTISKSLGSLYSLGFDIDWSGFYNRPTRGVDVPTYPFQLQSCWSESIESRFTRQSALGHPLLGEQVEGPLTQWQSRIDLKLQEYLGDHRVRGAIVYPAAAVVETAIAAGEEILETDQVCLQRLRLLSPCVLSEQQPQRIRTTYMPDRRQLNIAFSSVNKDAWSPLAAIELSRALGDEVGPYEMALQAARERCSEAIDHEKLYTYCDQAGLNYGNRFKGIVSGMRRDGEAIAVIDVESELGEGATDGYHCHPCILDSCFHAMIAADGDFNHTIDGLYLPLEISRLQFVRRLSGPITAHARVLHKSKKRLVCDVDLFDASGRLCLSISRFQSVRIKGAVSRQETTDLIYSYHWAEKPLADHAVAPAGDEKAALPDASSQDRPAPLHWMVMMDDGTVGRELRQRLRARGDHVTEVYRDDSQVAQTVAENFYQVDVQDQSSFATMLTAVVADSGSPVDRVVYLWGLDTPEPHQLDCDSLEQSTQITSLAPMHLVQAWEETFTGHPAELAIVTSGAQSQDGAPELTMVAQAPLVGFGRVIVSEYSRLQTKLIDLPATISTNDLDNLVDELLAADEEDEVMWRDGQRHVHRFDEQATNDVSLEAAQSLPCRLAVGRSSGIEGLVYSTTCHRPLKPGEVEIEVLASGLNFSDVMKALDLYPGLEDGPVELGAECSGRISRVGPNTQWQPGDEVIAVAPGSFGTHVIVNQVLVARKPVNLSHQQAAAIPIAFLTADYALNECARLQSGESVLIHSASGGVGLAAMQLAALGGIQVYATAGTDEKREFVRQRGAEQVMDSRTLEFGRQTLAATDGKGVDAVLNSLPGEAISQGLSVLKVGGRFLEIGKRDIYGDAPLGLFPFRNNLSMFAIDLDQLFKQQPVKMGAMLQRLVERFESNELEPLPVRAYTADEVVAAFRYMQQGKHIGKVVVTYEPRPSSIKPGDYLPSQFRSDATYWIAGGLGGFGLEIARWMVDRGARSLVLSGRSHNLRPQAEHAIAEFEKVGAKISVMPADITQPQEVQRVLQQIDQQLPPLVGVIHTAMVLVDKLIVDLDRETLEKVLRPKVLGGWNLHHETLGRELDCFVVFSSLSSVFGHAGQANYSAANALLDSLAYYRRALGLPALVMNWGHLGEVGYLAEREQLGERLERQGVLSFSIKEATNCLEYALQLQAIQLSVLKMDWTVWRGLGITNRVSPRFAHLLRQQGNVAATGDMPGAEALRAVTGQQRAALVDNMLRTKTGSLLGIDPGQIQADRALLEMGLDSLMAVEMRNWIESQMEIAVPISALMRTESLSDLAGELCNIIDGVQVDAAKTDDLQSELQLSDGSADEPAKQLTPDQDAAVLLDQIESLEDDQVSELLGQLLREKE